MNDIITHLLKNINTDVPNIMYIICDYFKTTEYSLWIKNGQVFNTSEKLQREDVDWCDEIQTINDYIVIPETNYILCLCFQNKKLPIDEVKNHAQVFKLLSLIINTKTNDEKAKKKNKHEQ